jgi:spermidine/putrescine transport system permease protein
MARTFSVRTQPGFTFIAMLCFFLLYLPIVTLVVYAFNSGQSVAVWEGFSFRWFESAWHNRAIQEASLRSIFIATFAATVATLVATMAALATTRTTPYPGLTFKYAFINQPLMVLPLYAAIDRFDTRLLEAGFDLYARRWQVLVRIVLPIVRPGIVAGSILVFVPSLGAYVTPRVLGGGKNMMLGNLIELQFGQGRNWPLGAALSITLMIIVTLALLVYVKNASKSGGGHG